MGVDAIISKIDKLARLMTWIEFINIKWTDNNQENKDGGEDTIYT